MQALCVVESIGYRHAKHAPENYRHDGSRPPVAPPAVDVQSLLVLDARDEVIAANVHERVGGDEAIDDGQMNQVNLRLRELVLMLRQQTPCVTDVRPWAPVSRGTKKRTRTKANRVGLCANHDV